MSSGYRLVYFDLPGIAETARIMFRLAKQEFEDQRFPFKMVDGKPIRAEWDADKQKYVYQLLPVLFHEGAEIPQSGAINRYLARKFGFLGSNEIEAALIDGAVEQLNDAKKVWWTVRGKSKEEMTEKFFQTTLKHLFQLYSAQATKLKSAPGHLIGNKLSLIDILIYQLQQMLSGDNLDELMALVKEFPVIEQIMEKSKSIVGELVKYTM